MSVPTQKFVFVVDLPPALATEITRVAREREMSPADMAAEALESLLASSRLSRMPPRTQTPRLVGQPRPRITAELLDDHEPRVLSDAPTLTDLSSLADIT